jgi:hypothetical protein
VFVNAEGGGNADCQSPSFLASDHGGMWESRTAAGQDGAALVRDGSSEFLALLKDLRRDFPTRGPHDAYLDPGQIHCVFLHTPNSLRSGAFVKQRPGVSQAHFRYGTVQQPGDFFGARFVAEVGNRSDASSVLSRLRDIIVMLRHDRNLGDMGDADGLVRLRESSESLGHVPGDVPPHSGVDFVKHESGDPVGIGKYGFEREHDPADLTA